MRADISARSTDGDAKWVPAPVPVTGGAYYTFSDWYKSSINSAVSVEYWTAGQDTSGDGTWANLFSGIAPASNWTQYQTGFTMPPGAVAATFVHFIAGVGWLQTDDYSMTQETTPPGFSAPMVSLTFDDGSAGFYANALPLLNAKGFKTTQYIPTGCESGADPTACGLGKDPFMMTQAQVQELATQGHEIGSHSVTHPDLTTITSDSQLASEFTQSKATLEAITGAGTVTDFAYPYGTYDARVIAAEQKAGYASGRSVEEGYNSKLDLQPYDIRVQNMLPTTTPAEFQGWIDYAKSHNYWLVIVYHEVQPDGTPVCQNPDGTPGGPVDPDPCVGPYDTTVSQFQQQLNYIGTAGVDVKTVRDAMKAADTQIHAPSVASVAITPTNPTTGSTLTATPGAVSYPGTGKLTYTYAWSVNGQPATGGTDATGTKFTLQPGVKHGDKIAVTLSVSDGTYTSDPVVSAPLTVANSAPTGLVTISPGNPSAGTALTATPAFSDADGDALTYKYAWSLNGQPIPGVTGNYLAGSMVSAGTVSVQVTADDGQPGGTSAPASASVAVGDYPLAGTVTITPANPTTDQTMVATPSGFTDPQRVGLTYSYQWLVNGAPAPGATGDTFDLSQPGHGDHGDKVQVKVTATNAYGSIIKVSDPVTVANTAPTGGSVAIAPADPMAGTALTATPSGFTDADADALSYQFSWFHNGQLIAQNTTGILPGSSVLAGTVSVQVTADDGHGGTSQAAPASVAVAAPPAPVVQPPAPVVQPPAPVVQPPAPAADSTPPQIAISSPSGAIYRRGQMLVVKFACQDGSGVASCTATLGPVGAKASQVTSGKKVLLSKNGRYVLSISARDGVGNFGSKTVFFRVTDDRTPPAISIASPRGATYRLGQSLLVKFSCSDGSGVAGCSATLSRAGGKASKVTSGGRVRLSKRGRYVLRVSARDGVGNAGTRTLYFNVR